MRKAPPGIQTMPSRLAGAGEAIVSPHDEATAGLLIRVFHGIEAARGRGRTHRGGGHSASPSRIEASACPLASSSEVIDFFCLRQVFCFWDSVSGPRSA